MRALDFILENTEVLDEVAMNPTRLKQEAAKTGAQAGMEFEMIVPNTKSEDMDDYDPEPDYDSDESASSIRDIRDFFNDGNYNSRRQVDQLVDELTEKYYEWADEHRSEQWDSEGKDYLREYIENEGEFDEDAALEEAYDQLGLTSEQQEAANKAGATITKRSDAVGNEDWEHWKEARDLVSEKLDQFVEEQWDEQGRLYDNAREKWMDESDWPDESDWLENEGIDTMQDVLSYDITWPHWYYPDSGGELSIDDIADEFSRMIDKPINASKRYHGARREAGHYVVEPDGSLEPDDSDDAGLEFVSPPMPIDEMLSDFNKVVAWAKDKGCYTNDSTGLHINVSVPDFSREKLDYVKLAILLGDEYILKEFGRQGNTYTKSALGRVKDNIRSRPEDAKRLLDSMKSGLSDIASKAVHSGATDKYTSINTKDGYIEFRSPGGDWLDADIPKVENTLLRFVVALDAACDPQKYRKEYLTKLYKLLSPSKDATDTIQYFTKYAAGELPKAALRSFVKQAQLERKIKADKEQGKKYWWRVDKEGRGARNGASVEVVATSKEEALEKAASEWNIRLGALTQADAYPVRKVEEPELAPYDPNGKYIISKFKADGPNTVAYRFSADTWNKADWVLTAWLTANNITDRDDVRKYSIRFDPEKNEGQAEGHETTNTPRYEIFNLNTNNSVEDAEGITNDREALIRLNDYLQHGPHRLSADQARDTFGIRRVGDSEPILAQPISRGGNQPQSRFEIYRISDGRALTRRGEPLEIVANGVEGAERQMIEIIRSLDFGAPELFAVRSVIQPPSQPGSTQDIQQQRAAGGAFTGAWKVLANGREVYRFSGVGNQQSDANRVAIQWLRNNGYDQGTEVEVVPIMS